MKTKKFKRFLDYDKEDKLFYNNLYINELKIVVKIPILTQREEETKEEFRIEEFNLRDYTYLLSYDRCHIK